MNITIAKYQVDTHKVVEEIPTLNTLNHPCLFFCCFIAHNSFLIAIKNKTGHKKTQKKIITNDPS